MRVLLLAVLILAGCTTDETDPASVDSPPETPVRHVDVPSGAESGTPRLALTPDGRPLLSWSEPHSDGHALRYAFWENGGWSEARTAASGSDWFVNWADTPGVVPSPDGGLLAFWLTRHPDGESPYAYDIRYSLSNDEGTTWTEPALLNTDGVAAEHGFVSARPGPDGMHLAWLDGRSVATDSAMTLRAARLAPDGSRSDETVLDPRVCDCCPTSMAMTDSGPIVAFRDRSEDEIRDIALTRLVDGTWTEPTVFHNDGWKIDGCPVNGPAIAANDDWVALAWFSGARQQTRVFLALSEDGGATFSNRIPVDEGRPLGRVDLALVPGGAVVTWLEATDEGVDLRLRRLSLDSRPSPEVVTIASLPEGRDTGIPRLLPIGDSLLVAWTHPDTDAPLQSAVLPF